MPKTRRRLTFEKLIFSILAKRTRVGKLPAPAHLVRVFAGPDPFSQFTGPGPISQLLGPGPFSQTRAWAFGPWPFSDALTKQDAVSRPAATVCGGNKSQNIKWQWRMLKYGSK